MMCKRDMLLMFNFLQNPERIHLHQEQAEVLTEVFMRETERENTLRRDVLFLSWREQTK